MHAWIWYQIRFLTSFFFLSFVKNLCFQFQKICFVFLRIGVMIDFFLAVRWAVSWIKVIVTSLVFKLQLLLLLMYWVILYSATSNFEEHNLILKVTHLAILSLLITNLCGSFLIFNSTFVGLKITMHWFLFINFEKCIQQFLNIVLIF